MGKLTGKVAIITGGASGIGKRTAQLFVAEGAKVLIGDILDREGKAVVAGLGGRALYRHADVRVENDVRRLVDTAVKRLGRLDCLVNNAGISRALGGISTISVEDWDDHVNTHLRGVFLGLKHAAPILVGQGSGSIINMGSVAGLQAGFGPYPYSAAKAAIAHLTQCAAMELAVGGVRVNCVCPGAIPTPIFGKSFGMSQAEAEKTVPRLETAFQRMQPLARAGQALDIARCVLWLASDDSTFVTGQTVFVDGGLTSGRSWAASQATRGQLMVAMGLQPPPSPSPGAPGSPPPARASRTRVARRPSRG